MTKALVLKSRMRRKSHVRFGSGGEGGDPLTDHNCAIRSSETDAIKQRGMEGKGQVIEDSHDLLITKKLDNCASIQVRCYT
jgi:hypothetical protein